MARDRINSWKTGFIHLSCVLGYWLRVESKVVWEVVLEGVTGFPWAGTEGGTTHYFSYSNSIFLAVLGVSLRFQHLVVCLSWFSVYYGFLPLSDLQRFKQFCTDCSRSCFPDATFSLKFIFKAPKRMPCCGY